MTVMRNEVKKASCMSEWCCDDLSNVRAKGDVFEPLWLYLFLFLRILQGIWKMHFLAVDVINQEFRSEQPRVLSTNNKTFREKHLSVYNFVIRNVSDASLVCFPRSRLKCVSTNALTLSLAITAFARDNWEMARNSASRIARITKLHMHGIIMHIYEIVGMQCPLCNARVNGHDQRINRAGCRY